MQFIDFFSGIGGFRRGLELSGHKCVGFCEWDKFATASYTSMHLLTEEQRIHLSKMTTKQRQKEILREEYRNNEWYASDIRDVTAKNLPKSDCWCFGAPCQDFSIAGKRAGLEGDRSSLIREIFRLLEEQEEQDRPEWLIYENVKGMLSSNRGLDYLSILSEMDRLGYDIEWQNINSKWWVPQNRERIYTIGHLRRYGSAKILPVTGADGENSVQLIANRKGYHRNTQTFSPDGITEALDTGQGGGRGHHVGFPCFVDMNYGAGIKTTTESRTIQARYYKGICNRSAELSGVCVPVLTPERENKRQNGRRFKENGDPMFTLTAQDRHGVAIDLKAFSSNTRGYPFRYGYASTLDHNCNQGVIGGIYTNVSPEYQRGVYRDISRGLKANKHDCGVVLEVTREIPKQDDGIYLELPQGFTVYAIWYKKEQCYITIRRLTPKECFRLQGWTDDYFEKAAFVNSDSQLYKQAGNGVTVDVVKAIGEKIKSYEVMKWQN